MIKAKYEMSRKLIELIRVFSNKVPSVAASTTAGTECKSGTIEEELRLIKSENADLVSAYEITQQELDDIRERTGNLEIETQQKAIIDLFKQMNSSEYGNVLDNVAHTAKQIKDLKANGWEPSAETENSIMTIRMYHNFLKKYGITPMLEIDSELQINLAQSENYDYEGSEFKDGKEIKKVKVYAPGWTFGKDIISSPKVQESF
jgi:molecular chaperone GrpE (heat shock protein)